MFNYHMVSSGLQWDVMIYIVQKKSKGKRYTKRILLVFESLVSFVWETQLNSAGIWLIFPSVARNIPVRSQKIAPFLCVLLHTEFLGLVTFTSYKSWLRKGSALSWSLIFPSSIFSLCFYKHQVSILLYIIFSVYFLNSSPWFYYLSFSLPSFLPFFLRKHCPDAHCSFFLVGNYHSFYVRKTILKMFSIASWRSFESDSLAVIILHSEVRFRK